MCPLLRKSHSVDFSKNIIRYTDANQEGGSMGRRYTLLGQNTNIFIYLDRALGQNKGFWWFLIEFQKQYLDRFSRFIQQLMYHFILIPPLRQRHNAIVS